MSLQNLNTNSLNNPTVKGLNTDLSSHLQTKEIWTYGRNSVLTSHSGNVYALQNEQSNFKCVDLPYTYIGSIPLVKDRFAIFTTDNTNSEIGIFDSTNCTYSTVINDPCLNFSTSYLISGKSKYNYDCSESIYWADSGRNSRRYLNLNKVPYVNIGTECSPIYTTQLDCNKILIDPLFSVPYIYPQLINEGNLKNGSYQFAIAYAIKNERFTDIYSFTNQISIFSHNNLLPKGISLDIHGLDNTFDQYELFVAYTIDNGITTYKSLGFYTTAQSKITIASVERAEYTSITTTDIFVKKQMYDKADWCEGNDQYLLWAGLTAPIEIGYQPQAMNILSNYVIVEAPSDYYKNNFNLGYYGDESYAFAIQWLRANGSYTNAYHIPGTIYGSGTTTNYGSGITANSADIYELSGVCSADGIPPGWYVQNGAARLGQMKIGISGSCDLTITASGSMAYMESTDLYPNNTDMFGNSVCTPIRHHRFPNEAVEPRFNPINNPLSGTTGNIRIKTIQFTNIEHPKDSNGNYLKDIVGYRIVRSDRSGNRTVIVRGYSTNMRYYKEYTDPYTQAISSSTIYYPNYPYNSLQNDPYLGSNGFYSYSDLHRGFKTIQPLTSYSQSIFTFYSPHTLISNIALGSEVIFESDDYGVVTGQFTTVYQHPQWKLWSDSGLNSAIDVGIAKVVLDVLENMTSTTPLGATIGIAGIGLDIVGAASDGIKYADEYMTFVNNTVEWQQYVLQYNSSCLFNNTINRTSATGRRRGIIDYSYLGDGLNVIPGLATTFVNNFKKPQGVRININANINTPSVSDTTLISGNTHDLNVDITNTTASLYYTTIKRRIPNQYGPLDSFKYINTDYEVKISSLTSSTNPVFYSTSPIFGGDCFINKFSVNQQQLFWKNFPLNTPNGTIWDYREYRNLAFPQFWINAQPYNVIDKINDWFKTLTSALNPFNALLSSSGSHPTSTDAESRFNMDQYTGSSSTDIIRTPSYMYDSYNGVVYQYVESDYNLEFRDYHSNTSNIYQINPDTSYIFKSNNYFLPEEFVYDISYSKQNLEVYAIQQALDFNIATATNCSPYWVNSVIYSLIASEDIHIDHWLYYLPGNIYNFPINDFGYFTSMHGIDNQQIIFFFDKAGPYVSIGRDELQLDNSGTKVTIGDAGLFERPPRPITFTDYKLGSSSSRFSFKPTAYGNYFVSQQSGKVFEQQGLKAKPISDKGNKYWFSQFLPSQLLLQYPDFQDKDNQVAGVGIISTYDPTYETFIMTKKDYKALDPNITYNPTTNQFLLNQQPVSLKDPNYFEDASFTISYKADLGVYVSWHDYQPIGYLQSALHFMSIIPLGKQSSIYKHNELYNSYCNFYSKDYPFAVQLPVNNQTNVETIKSIEFFAETYVYKNQWDYFHVLDTTFDQALLVNSEQISGWLHLNPIVRNQVSQQFLYPYYNSGTTQYEIKLDKVEQKYRFNQFWDITKDRGEYSGAQNLLITTKSNGYDFYINANSVDYNKPQTQRKKFRHKTSKVHLQKNVSGNNKIILHFTDTKQTNSPR